MKTVSSLYFQSILTILEGMGLDKASVLSHINCDEDDLLDLKYRMSLEETTRSFDFAASALNKPNIGLEVGHKFRIYTFAKTGSVLAYSETLREAVEINSHYNCLVETVGRSGFVRGAAEDYMTWDNGDIDPNQHKHVTELIIAGYVMTAQWLSWSHAKGVKGIQFKHDRPARVDIYERLLQSPVQFNCAQNALQFDKGIADEELPSSNPEKLAMVRKRLNIVLASFNRQQTLKDAVAYTIAKAIKSQSLSEEAIAKSLGTSGRNMRRNLSKEGATYRDLVSQVRMELCESYMRAGRQFTDIAQLLGYSDQSAFTKAFKTWHGVTPSKYKVEIVDLSF